MKCTHTYIHIDQSYCRQSSTHCIGAEKCLWLKDQLPVHSVPAISSSTWPQNMSGQEALTVFVCATACAAAGVTVVVSVGLLFSPGDLAVFSKVEGVTTITIAGRAAILIVSAVGAGVNAQIGIAVCTRSFIARKIVRRGVFPASSGRTSPVPKAAKEQFAPDLQHSDMENTNR